MFIFRPQYESEQAPFRLWTRANQQIRTDWSPDTPCGRNGGLASRLGRWGCFSWPGQGRGCHACSSLFSALTLIPPSLPLPPPTLSPFPPFLLFFSWALNLWWPSAPLLCLNHMHWRIKSWLRKNLWASLMAPTCVGKDTLGFLATLASSLGWDQPRVSLSGSPVSFLCLPVWRCVETGPRTGFSVPLWLC